MNAQTTTALPPVIHGSFTLERVFPKSPETVFAAFADAAKKRRWFAEGEGFSVQAYELDFRVGGEESCRFRFGDGPPMTFDAQYQDIVPNRRIVVAYRMTIGGAPLSASLITTEIVPEGTGARLTHTEFGAYLDGDANANKSREEGSRGLLEALAKSIEND